MIRPLNAFEKAEFLMDVGCSGNLNFSVISSYQGQLNGTVVQAGIKYLQQMHPLLRVVVDTSEKISHFIETTAEVPFKEYPYEGSEQWKAVIKKDLAGRFTIEKEPLWRVSLLKGTNEGQILVTFHHAIADGVCAMQMMNHFYQVMSQLLNSEQPEKIEYNTPLPELATLYPLSSKEPSEDLPISAREDKGYHTTFVKDVLDELTTTKVLEWTKELGIKVHATLFAALLQSVRRVVDPHFDELTAVTAVNYRSSFSPAVSKDVLTLLRTCISEKFGVQGHEDLASLAKAIHQSVHSQLTSGEHVLNLKVLEKRLLKDPTPQELWQRAKFPANAVTVSNVGSLDFSGNYAGNKLSLNELFFVANVEHFIEESTNFILGTLTFRGKTFLSLWFLDELVNQSVGQAILLEMKGILASLTTHSSHG